MKRRNILLQIVSLVIALVVPGILRNNNYQLDVFNLLCCYTVISLGYNLILGYTGMLSMGHAAFYGIGAYFTAVLSKTYGVPWPLSMLAGIVACFIVGYIVGFPSRTQKGIYLLLLTTGFNAAIKLVMQNWRSVTNGSAGFSGIPKIRWQGEYIGKLATAYLFLGITIMVIIATYRLVNSKGGRALVAIRDGEIAAEASGIDVGHYRCLSFAISAAYVGLAGGMYALNAGYIDPTTFSGGISTTILAMVIIGGMGSVPGSVIGAIIVTLSMEALRSFGDARMAIYGLLIILIIRFAPDGVIGVIKGCGNKLAEKIQARKVGADR